MLVRSAGACFALTVCTTGRQQFSATISRAEETAASTAVLSMDEKLVNIARFCSLLHNSMSFSVIDRSPGSLHYLSLAGQVILIRTENSCDVLQVICFGFVCSTSRITATLRLS
jgi:hypothetical protein